MSVPLYSGRAVYWRRFLRPRGIALAGTVYANVIVDIQARELKDKLFTYRVPEELAGETFIGAQVLVPFGPKEMVGGYVVSLSDQNTGKHSLKDIVEIVEPEPLFDENYIDFLYWLADYYCASISDVISAAIPSSFTPKLKRLVKLSEKLCAMTPQARATFSDDPAARALINVLDASKGTRLSMVALKQRWRKAARLPQSHFFRALHVLRQEGHIEIFDESTQAQAPKMQNVVILTGQEPASARHKQLIDIIARHGGRMTLKDLLEQGGTTHTTVKKLAAEQLVSIAQEEVLRDPLDNVACLPPQAVTLTDHQQNALNALAKDLESILASGAAAPKKVQPWLLFGVTGSGKTEIYLQLIQDTLNKGRSAMLLVPEISLTPQLARRLKTRFGSQVSVWHSALSEGERYDTWRRLRAGEVRVLLGARSAVLANLPDLGLIVLDEEHDGSYKQSTPSPRYHAKDVALEKARRHNAMVVLGSATPDVATYLRAKENSRILELPERVFKQTMPEVKIADMREEFAHGNRSIFSLALASGLTECLERGEQAILLMNRRGYASHVFCRACGHVVKCRHCSVSLVFHQSANKGQSAESQYKTGHLACHHCGFRSAAVETCPECKSPFIRQFGLGTQKVEEELKVRYPSARVLRLDSDVTTKKGTHEEILRHFAEGQADVLIGTQMVSKGLDIANVTLVGVLAADAAFNLPDYRSIERGFQLLTQVSGRAGRGERPGFVVLQTYNVDMPALAWAKNHDYQSFVIEELAARESLEYPPFSQLLRVVVAGNVAHDVEFACDRLAEEISHFLEDQMPDTAVKVLGPAPCLIERLRGKFRYHLLLKNMAKDEGRSLITDFLRRRAMAPGLSLAVDVDALDLL